MLDCNSLTVASWCCLFSDETQRHFWRECFRTAAAPIDGANIFISAVEQITQ